MLTVDTWVRRIARLAGGIGLLAWPAFAHARPPARNTAQLRFTMAEAMLETESGWAKKTRLLSSGLGIGFGATTVGIGSVLLARDATPGGVVIVAQGGLLLASGIHGLIWRRDPFEELMRDVDAAHHRGGASEASMYELEMRWYRLALRERRWRRIEGGTAAAVGGMLVTAAAAIAAAPGDMDPTLRGLYTRSLLGTGIGTLGVAVVKLLVPSAVERSYVSFERGTRSEPFRLVPLAGGSGLSLGASF